jgi:hypothetical protein
VGCSRKARREDVDAAGIETAYYRSVAASNCAVRSDSSAWILWYGLPSLVVWALEFGVAVVYGVSGSLRSQSMP